MSLRAREGAVHQLLQLPARFVRARDELDARHPNALRLRRWSRLVAWLTFAVVFGWAGLAGAQAVPSGQAGPIAATPVAAVPALPAAVPSAQSAPIVSVPSPGAVGEVPVPDPAKGSDPASFSIDLGSDSTKPSNSVLIIIGITLISIAPSLIIMMSSFTRIVIVLSLTRNALGLPAIPPNQVVVGLALFLSLFVMSPTLSKVNEAALQPLLAGEISSSEAASAATAPIKDFMLSNTRQAELKMLIDASGSEKPATAQDAPLTTVIPAFILSELKTAFIIGFVIFVPFLVIDLVVSAVLMALGMMMLPPAFVSLPFKLLLFVMVDGWSLLVSALLGSFR